MFTVILLLACECFCKQNGHRKKLTLRSHRGGGGGGGPSKAIENTDSPTTGDHNVCPVTDIHVTWQHLISYLLTSREMQPGAQRDDCEAFTRFGIIIQKSGRLVGREHNGQKCALHCSIRRVFQTFSCQ
jgi:hypothetical protein